MTIKQMREVLEKKYFGSSRIKNMPDAQIQAVYMRQLNAGKLKGYV